MRPNRLVPLVAALSAFIAVTSTAAPVAAQEDYSELKSELARQHTALSDAVDASALDESSETSVRNTVMAGIERLFDAWEGTRWGLGLPQTQTPGDGKINCGMFVGTVLVHAGFRIDHKKLQRQPAELIIKSLAPSSKIARFRNAPVDDFLEGVREMGPGLYIIGLDYHVGFLVVEPDDGIRYIHASIVTRCVVDMKADGAPTIEQSNYRVVGKILQEDMLRDWLTQTEIPVQGNW